MQRTLHSLRPAFSRQYSPSSFCSPSLWAAQLLGRPGIRQSMRCLRTLRLRNPSSRRGWRQPSLLGRQGLVGSCLGPPLLRGVAGRSPTTCCCAAVRQLELERRIRLSSVGLTGRGELGRSHRLCCDRGFGSTPSGLLCARGLGAAPAPGTALGRRPSAGAFCRVAASVGTTAYDRGVDPGRGGRFLGGLALGDLRDD